MNQFLTPSWVTAAPESQRYKWNAVNWSGRPAIGVGVDDGLPKGMAERLFSSYGDAVVPTIPEILGRAILSAHNASLSGAGHKSNYSAAVTPRRLELLVRFTEATMRVLGQYDTGGEYRAYTEPQDVFLFGQTLRDSDGFVVAVKDSYGDWVSPSLHRIGLKSKIEVET